MFRLRAAVSRPRARDGCVFRIVCFLCATYVDLESLPRLVLLPHDRVSGGASLREGSVSEDDQAWSLPVRFVSGSRFVFDDCRGAEVFH